MKLLFGGDFVPNGIPNYVFQKASLNLRSVDLKNTCLIVNLEAPIIRSADLESNSGLISKEENLKYYTEFMPDVVCLANNHILDLSEEGLGDTINIIEKLGINYVGIDTTFMERAIALELDKNTYLLNYCFKGLTHLKQVTTPTNTSPGVAILSADRVKEDLAKLPEKCSVIIYTHWGYDNSWLPTSEDLETARQILRYDKVKLMLGTHAHKTHGCVTYDQKKAYLGLGHFYFPDFVVKPPLICDTVGDNNWLRTMHNYTPVRIPTLKRWSLTSRIGMMVEFDTSDNTSRSLYVYMSRDNLAVTEITGFYLQVLKLLHFTNSKFLMFPKNMYNFTFYLERKRVDIIFAWSLLLNLGVRRFLAKIVAKIKDA